MMDIKIFVNSLKDRFNSFKKSSIYVKANKFFVFIDSLLYKHRVGIGQFVFGVFGVFLIFGIILPSFFPMIDMISSIGGDLRSGNFKYFLVSLSFWCSILLFLHLTRNLTLNLREFLGIIGILLIVSLAVRFWFILSYSQQYYSDFKQYWSIASDMAENGLRPVTNTYVRRALPIFTPLIYFFGSDDIVFKVANVVFVTLSGLIATFMTGRWISYNAAIVAFAIVCVSPETYYASLIPTHDISGAFLLMVCLLFTFLGFEKVYRGQYKLALLMALLVPIFMVPLQLQRSLVGIFIPVFSLSILVFGAIWLGEEKNWSKKVVFIIVSLILMVFTPNELYKVLNRQTHKIIAGKSEKISSSSLGAHNRSLVRYNTLNNGSYSSQIAGLNNVYVKAIPEMTSRNDFMKSLYLSDFYYDPLERIPNFLLRSHRLFNLSSQMPFYMGRLKEHNRTEIREILGTTNAINRSFYSIFLLVLIWTAIYFVFKSKNTSLLAITSLFFMSILGIVFSTLFENQPRYLFMGYFIWPIAIGFAFSNIFNNKNQKNNNSWQITPVKFGNASLLSFLFIIVISAIIYFAFLLKFQRSELRMLNLSAFEVKCDEKVEEETCNKGIIIVPTTMTDRKWALLSLRLPNSRPKLGQFVLAEYNAKVNDNKLYTFETFIQQPYQSSDGRKGFFDIIVRANNKSTVLHLEDTDKEQFVRLEDITPVDGKVKISFEIKCILCSAAPSWQRASTTNFRFARLYSTGEPQRMWR